MDPKETDILNNWCNSKMKTYINIIKRKDQVLTTISQLKQYLINSFYKVDNNQADHKEINYKLITLLHQRQDHHFSNSPMQQFKFKAFKNVMYSLIGKNKVKKIMNNELNIIQEEDYIKENQYTKSLYAVVYDYAIDVVKIEEDYKHKEYLFGKVCKEKEKELGSNILDRLSSNSNIRSVLRTLIVKELIEAFIEEDDNNYVIRMLSYLIHPENVELLRNYIEKKMQLRQNAEINNENSKEFVKKLKTPNSIEEVKQIANQLINHYKKEKIISTSNDIEIPISMSMSI